MLSLVVLSAVLLLAVITFGALLVQRYAPWLAPLSPYRALPVPEGASLSSGHAVPYARDTHSYLAQCHKTLGRVFAVWLPAAADGGGAFEPVVYVNDPDWVRLVLSGRGGRFNKEASVWQDELWDRPVGGEAFGVSNIANLVQMFVGEYRFADSAAWQATRKALSRFFHARTVSGWSGVFAEFALRWADEWEAAHAEQGGAGHVDLQVAMHEITCEAIAFATLGRRLEEFERAAPELEGLRARVLEQMQESISFSTEFFNTVEPGARWQDHERAKKALEVTRKTYQLVLAMVRVRLGEQADSGSDSDQYDLLTLLKAAGPAAGESPSEFETRCTQIIMNLFVAGAESPATGLAYAVYLVASRPELVARVQHEVRAAAPEAVASGTAELPLLNRCYSEAMRLFPPATVVRRTAALDDPLAPVKGPYMPAGTTVAVSLHAIHRNPAVWSKPDEYDPDRFLPGRMTSKKRAAYMPFSTGPRACPGQRFSIVQAKAVLGALFSRFDFEPDVTRALGDECVRGKFATWRRHGIHVALAPRV